MRRAGLLTVACAALAACEGGGDPVQQALRDASAERQAAAYQGYDQTATETTDVPSASADREAVDRLIGEHRRAITAAETLRDSSDPALRQIAETTITARQREIAELQSWRPAATPTPGG